MGATYNEHGTLNHMHEDFLYSFDLTSPHVITAVRLAINSIRFDDAVNDLTVGSTLVHASISQDLLCTETIGDSGAYLFSRKKYTSEAWAVERINPSHIPDNEAEAVRMGREHISYFDGRLRVNRTLSLTRLIGATSYHRFNLSNEPQQTRVALDADKEYVVVLASDCIELFRDPLEILSDAANGALEKDRYPVPRLCREQACVDDFVQGFGRWLKNAWEESSSLTDDITLTGAIIPTDGSTKLLGLCDGISGETVSRFVAAKLPQRVKIIAKNLELLTEMQTPLLEKANAIKKTLSDSRACTICTMSISAPQKTIADSMLAFLNGNITRYSFQEAVDTFTPFFGYSDDVSHLIQDCLLFDQKRQQVYQSKLEVFDSVSVSSRQRLSLS